ncbi:MAG: sensor histidine kinase [Deinococcota bacterium]
MKDHNTLATTTSPNPVSARWGRHFNQGWLKRFRRPRHNPFDRIRWKLTWSYTVVGTVVTMLIEIIVLAGIAWILIEFFYQEAPSVLAEHAADAAPLFETPPPDPQASQIWLDTKTEFVVSDGDGLTFNLQIDDTGNFFVFDSQAELIATSMDDSRDGSYGLGNREMGLIRDMLTGQDSGFINAGSLFRRRFFVATPIMVDDEVRGVMAFSQRYALVADTLALLGVSLAVVSIFTVFIGTGFGLIAARGLTKRIAGLERVTQRWRRGDFSERVHDRSNDELGQLAGRLNGMAGDLATLVNTRQEMAMVEERNRLALELHDSIKQQVFAIGMKLGFVETMVEDGSPVQQSLNELAERVHQTQDELQRLIQGLKPVVLERQGLCAALRDYVTTWAAWHHTETKLTLASELANPQALPSQTGEALFRIAQEALMNVAKHSHAERVEVTLAYEPPKSSTSSVTPAKVTLTICDDGVGFDAEDVMNLNGESNGLGQRSMLERMSKLGGNLSLESEPGKGTTVRACVPLQSERTS